MWKSTAASWWTQLQRHWGWDDFRSQKTESETDDKNSQDFWIQAVKLWDNFMFDLRMQLHFDQNALLPIFFNLSPKRLKIFKDIEEDCVVIWWQTVLWSLLSSTCNQIKVCNIKVQIFPATLITILYIDRNTFFLNTKKVIKYS